jgi:hypothetical protein
MFHDKFRFLANHAMLGNMIGIVVIPLEDHGYQYIP